MVVVSISMMVMQFMNKKAFTLIDMLLTLIIISSLLVLTLQKEVEVDTKWISFSNDFLRAKTNSIINKEENELDSIYDFGYFHFNSNGHINKADTIEFNNKKIIVHLGNGYLTYE